MLHHLPPSSLIPFTAYRLRQASVLWRNPSHKQAVSLERHAYFLPRDAADLALLDTAAPKELLAERYGGEGIARNGGGARCGWDGEFQLKGTGRNPLAGSDSGFWHSHGAETVSGSTREAIWGEVAELALPYGGLRVCGIIDTGLAVPAFDGQGQDRGAITVRPGALRPGHYIRALGFSRADEQGRQLGLDADRVRQAVWRLPPALMQLTGTPCSKPMPDADDINAALAEMLRRWARQHAAANAKRMMHGTHSASNLSLDGRWLDFGTASTVSDYGPIILAKNGFAMWDRMQFARVIDAVWRAMQKYLPLPIARALSPPLQLMAIFRAEFELRLPVEFSKLLGLSEERAQALPATLRAALFASFRAIFQAGACPPFMLYPACPQQRAHMPSQMGRYSLNRILLTAATEETPQGLEQALAPLLPEHALRSPLVAVLGEAKALYLGQFDGATRRHASAALQFNCLRLNAPLPSLYRPELDRAIDACVRAGADVPAFVQETVAKAALHLQDSAPEATFLGLLPHGVRVSELHGARSSEQTVPMQELISQLAQS